MIIYWKDTDLQELEVKLLNVLDEDNPSNTILQIFDQFKEYTRYSNKSAIFDAYSLLCIWYFETLNYQGLKGIKLSKPLKIDNNVIYMGSTDVSFIINNLLKDLFKTIEDSERLYNAVEAYYQSPKSALDLLLILKGKYEYQFLINYLICLIYMESNEFDKAKKDKFFDGELFMMVSDAISFGYSIFLPYIDYDVTELLESNIDKEAELLSLRIENERLKQKAIELPDEFNENHRGLLSEDEYNALIRFDNISMVYIKENFKNDSWIKEYGNFKQLFLTAEWIWEQNTKLFISSQHKKISGYDLSFMLVNYFKAIEVLLCKMANYYYEGEKSIIDKKKGTIIEWGTEVGYTRSTLGNFVHFYRDKVNYFKWDQINYWIKSCRNALDHKDVVSDFKTLEKKRLESYGIIKYAYLILIQLVNQHNKDSQSNKKITIPYKEIQKLGKEYFHNKNLYVN